MKKIDVALIIGLVFTLLFSNLSVFAKNYDTMREKVLRFHILANSNSAADQALKIKVRDAVLEYTKEIFVTANSRQESEERVAENLQQITKIAKNVIEKNGYDYSVKCQLVNMHFDERVYDAVTLPEGDYDALRITIGQANGHNWWCVMYPPLCVSAASDMDDVLGKFSPEEVKNR
ncbi:MAG: stage II sporulation protein R [Oscillospiraceae bacterium]